MGCTKSLDLSPSVSGAHLSFYWTMDDSALGHCNDSTVGLTWPMQAGTSSAPGLFNAGVEVNHIVRGLQLINSPSIVIDQTVSQGVSYWFWMKVVAFGQIPLLCDLNDFFANKFDFLLAVTSIDAVTTQLELLHQSDSMHFVDIFSPLLSWSLGTWHMIACTYDKPNQTLNIYADSVLVQTSVDALVCADLVSSLWGIGFAAPIGTVPTFIFDELGLCLNGALTQAQVTSLWNGGAGVTWPAVSGIVPFP